MRAVKIKMTGKLGGTRVFDAETGAEIDDIVSLSIEQEAGMVPIATLVIEKYVSGITEERP